MPQALGASCCSPGSEPAMLLVSSIYGEFSGEGGFVFICNNF